MIKNLVLGSGGVSGIAFLGALKELQQQNYLDLSKIECYCGCSIGSFISYLLIIGYTIDDIITLATKMDFKDFLDIKAEDAISFFHNYGFDNGKRLRNILEKIATRNGRNPLDKDLTLKDLYNRTGKRFIITVVCLDNRKPVYLDYKKYPDLNVIDSLRASMAIPFLFQPVKLKDKYYIDGGVIKSFPIEIFHKHKEETFGIKSSYMHRFFDNHNTEDITDVMSNFKNFVLHVFYCPATNSYKIPRDMKCLVTDIKGDGLQITNSTNLRLKYIECGVLDAKNYLKNLDINKDE